MTLSPSTCSPSKSPSRPAGFSAVPFEPHHAIELRVQPHQRLMHAAGDMFVWATMAKLYTPEGLCYTGILDHRVVGCGGLRPLWYGRAEAWCLLADPLGARAFLAGTRAVMAFLDERQQNPAYRRIETTVDDGVPQAHRWARRIGFRPEGLMRKFGPEGRDYYLYARIKT